jgi:hypothetical protein
LEHHLKSQDEEIKAIDLKRHQLTILSLIERIEASICLSNLLEVIERKLTQPQPREDAPQRGITQVIPNLPTAIIIRTKKSKR